jgi:Holliday junction DNA helicase RuvA
MIHSLHGTIQAINDQKIILEVGPVGVAIQVPTERSFVVGKQITLQTYLHWHAENGPSLFGFATDLERTIFLLVISCSGVGPKLGLAILDQMGPQAFLQAINESNQIALSKVSGIGAKKAEQIIVQLRSKVSALIKSGVEIGANGQLEEWHSVSQVLESLNYSRTEITHAMQHLGDSCGGKAVAFDQLMRQALSFLARSKSL